MQHLLIFFEWVNIAHENQVGTGLGMSVFRGDPGSRLERIGGVGLRTACPPTTPTLFLLNQSIRSPLFPSPPGGRQLAGRTNFTFRVSSSNGRRCDAVAAATGKQLKMQPQPQGGDWLCWQTLQTTLRQWLLDCNPPRFLEPSAINQHLITVGRTVHGLLGAPSTCLSSSISQQWACSSSTLATSSMVHCAKLWAVPSPGQVVPKGLTAVCAYVMLLFLLQGKSYQDMLLIGDLSGHIAVQQITNTAFMGGYSVVSI